jgi:hypothetical protein
VRVRVGGAMSLGPRATLTSVGGGVDATGTTAEATMDIGDIAVMGEVAGTGGTLLVDPSSVPKARWTAAGVRVLEALS